MRTIRPYFAWLLLLAFLSLTDASSHLEADEADNGAPPVEKNPHAVKPGTASEPTFSTEDLEFFEKQVRPVLVQRCYECHRSDLEEPKGGLLLDSRRAILQGGDTGPAAVPGDLKESLLIDAVRYGDIYQMPPKSRLPEAELAVLERWVERGLPWPEEAAPEPGQAQLKHFDLQDRKSEHWAWQPIAQVKPPAVTQADWPANDIDRFILAKLEDNKLQPSAPAAKSALLRRIYFDLIGLPPTVEQVEAFLADDSTEAVRKLVDRLLASPQFGERWGRHWLDLVRYAESRGHEFDYTIPNVWQYRDYVIRAFNADVPYDQFIKEHFAGDLLPQPRLNPEHGFNESILGTGFWFLGEWVHSPVDIRKDETDRQDNMIDVASKTFLALTVSCARCHDHKFDAISQADYYALAGYLQSSHYRLARFETMEHNQRIAKQLTALDALYAPLLAKELIAGYQPVLAKLDQYLLQSAELLSGSTETPEKADPVVSELLGTPKQKRDEQIKQIARQQKLEPAVLSAWVDVLQVARAEPAHPLHAFAHLASEITGETESANTISSLLEPLRSRWSARLQERMSTLTDARILVDYSALPPAEFLPGCVAFGEQPVKTGSLILGSTARKPLEGVERFGSAKRPAVWSNLKPVASADQDPGRLSGWVRAGQTLFTPTFQLQSGRLFYLVEGKGRIYATVHSHVTNNGPLHGHLLSSFDTKIGSGPQWIEHNLSTYAGQTLHIEFTAEGNRDCAVLKVIESPTKPAPFAPSQQWLAQTLPAEIATRAALAKIYQQIFQSVCSKIENQSLTAAEQKLTPQRALELSDQADLADWIINQPELFIAPDNSAQKRLEELGREYQAKRAELTGQIRQESQIAMAMQDGSGMDELLLIRGNSRTPGDPVQRRLLSALGGDEHSAPALGSGRLQLAEQILSPSNPFPARVMVNRVWHHLMGRGLVASVDNFGVLGESPTHPELLDHLANSFVDQQWSIKQIIREIMLSKTYQMAAQHTAQADELDPNNLLWHRANVRRLPGEIIRDSLLAVSGHMDSKQFGPSVPIHLTNFLQGRGRPASGPIDGQGRRSIYLSIRRNFLSPMMLAFDMPIPFTTMGRRNVSNVPAQALILMNDPLVVEQSHKWAERILASEEKTRSERIARMYQTAFARLPSSAELAAAEAFFDMQVAELKLSPEQAQNHPQLWADFAHVIFNAKEFIFLQ